jgi:hypothetical protein
MPGQILLAKGTAMIGLKNARVQLHADLGYKPLNKLWAKLEIFLGLWTNGLGILLMLVWSRGYDVIHGYWTLALFGLALFTLGGYLLLAAIAAICTSRKMIARRT